MKPNLVTGTILQIVPDANTGAVQRATVKVTSRGRYVAVFGPGMYGIVKAAMFPVGTCVYLSIEPVPTIVGLAEFCDGKQPKV